MSRNDDLKKDVLDFLNAVFLILALLMVGFGIYALVKFEWGSELVGFPLPTAFIAFGAFLLLLAGVGLLGVQKHSWVLLLIYFVVLLLCFLLELSFFFLALSFQNNAEEQLFQGWLDLTPSARSEIQDALTCCGFYSPISDPGPDCPVDADTGCFPLVKDAVDRNLLAVQIGIAVFVLIQLLALAFSLTTLMKMPRKRGRVGPAEGVVPGS